MPPEPIPEFIDDDTPEANTEWFERAWPAKDVLPGLVGHKAAAELLAPKRGWPSQEFIARREQRRVLDLMGKLEWDPSFDYKAERVRK